MFLALDSVFNQCSVALISHDGDVLSLDTQTGKRAQTQQILPMIQTALAQVGGTLATLEALIFNRGPGAFSGIRINTAVVQALSVAHDLPCVPVSSLQVLAQASLEQYGIEECYAVHDAKMKQVYIGHFTSDTKLMQAQPLQLLREQLQSKELSSVNNSNSKDNNKGNSDDNLVEKIEQPLESLLDYEQQTALNLPLVGDGAALLLPHENQKIIAELTLDASILGRLGVDKYAKNGGIPAEQALPVYLRNNAWKTLKEQGRA